MHKFVAIAFVLLMLVVVLENDIQEKQFIRAEAELSVGNFNLSLALLDKTRRAQFCSRMTSHNRGLGEYTRKYDRYAYTHNVAATEQGMPLVEKSLPRYPLTHAELIYGAHISKINPFDAC